MTSIINHIPNTFYVELREDYIMLCSACTYRKSDKSKSSPYCKALILAIMERWTNHKATSGDLRVSMTIPQWGEAMYGMFGRSVIIDSLEELVHDGFLSREAYKSARGGKEQYLYLLNHQVVNERLATVTFNRCQEEQRLKVDDQSVKVTVAASINNLCSSSPTSTSNPFIEETKNLPISSDKETISLSSNQQQWIDQIYLRSDMAHEPRQNVTQAFASHIAKLMEAISTVEELNSLYAHSVKKTPGDTLYAGNLVRCLAGWQKQQAEEAREQEFLHPTKQVNEELVPGPNDELPQDYIERITEFSEQCGDANVERNVKILTSIYQQARCEEWEIYQALLDARKAAQTAEQLFELMGKWLNVEIHST